MSFNYFDELTPSLSLTSPPSTTSTGSATSNNTPFQYSGLSGLRHYDTRGGCPPPPPFATHNSVQDEHRYQQGIQLPPSRTNFVLSEGEPIEINPRPLPPGFVHCNNNNNNGSVTQTRPCQFRNNVSPAPVLPRSDRQHPSLGVVRGKTGTEKQRARSDCTGLATLCNAFDFSSNKASPQGLLRKRRARRDSASGSTYHSPSSSLARGFENIDVDDTRSISRRSNGRFIYPAGNHPNKDIPQQIVLLGSVFQEDVQSNHDDDEDDIRRFRDIPVDSQAKPGQEWMSSPEVKRGTVSLDCAYGYENDASPQRRMQVASRGGVTAAANPHLVELQDTDVLGGQGSGSNDRPANKQYLQKVIELQERYKNLKKKDSMGKRTVAMEVYNFVSNKLGGRFVDKVPFGTDDLVVEMSEEDALEKIKRALRENRKNRPSRVPRKHASWPVESNFQFPLRLESKPYPNDQE